MRLVVGNFVAGSRAVVVALIEAARHHGPRPALLIVVVIFVLLVLGHAIAARRVQVRLTPDVVTYIGLLTRKRIARTEVVNIRWGQLFDTGRSAGRTRWLVVSEETGAAGFGLSGTRWPAGTVTRLVESLGGLITRTEPSVPALELCRRYPGAIAWTIGHRGLLGFAAGAGVGGCFILWAYLSVRGG